MTNPFDINRELEAAICAYTGAPFAVLTNSCTMALRLCLDWHMKKCEYSHVPIAMAATHLDVDQLDIRPSAISWVDQDDLALGGPLTVTIPKRTYVSVAMQIKAAGFNLAFVDCEWRGAYRLAPFNIYDSARLFTSSMFDRFDVDDGGGFVCVSFHSTKTLGIKRRWGDEYSEGWDIEQGGAILHNSPEADKWFRRARFDGRTEGVEPKDDTFDMIGHHCYMSPATARLGLAILKQLPEHNAPMANDPYPDLSLHPVFK
jgi:dTDP-4-amino-4,6-dideoxygalactose transaminase